MNSSPDSTSSQVTQTDVFNELKSKIMNLNKQIAEYASKKLKDEDKQIDFNELVYSIVNVGSLVRKTGEKIGISTEGRFDVNTADMKLIEEFSTINDLVKEIKNEVSFLLNASSVEVKKKLDQKLSSKTTQSSN